MVALVTSVLLALSSLTVPFVAAETCSTKFSTQPACNQTYGVATFTAHGVQSQLLCAHLCNQDNNCTSMMYDAVSKTCSMNTMAATSLTTSCGEPLKYAAITESTCRPQTQPSQHAMTPCTTTADCPTNTECVDLVCQCVSGWSYNPSDGTCVTSCGTYGNTYQTFTGYAMAMLNDKVINSLTADECKNACTTETTFVCRTAELSTSTSTCYLSTATAFTHPTDYIVDTTYTFWHRNCA